jgi:hypothetical protein
VGEFRRDLLPDAAGYFEEQGLKLMGRGPWRTTTCEFHGGKSMRVNVKNGAWVCMNCGARGGDVLAYQRAATGQDFVAAARALGAYVDNGKPDQTQTRPTPLPARAALEVLHFESQLVATAAANVAHGVQLGASDHRRLLKAAGRIDVIARMFN